MILYVQLSSAAWQKLASDECAFTIFGIRLLHC